MKKKKTAITYFLNQMFSQHNFKSEELRMLIITILWIYRGTVNRIGRLFRSCLLNEINDRLQITVTVRPVLCEMDLKEFENRSS